MAWFWIILDESGFLRNIVKSGSIGLYNINEELEMVENFFGL